MQERLDNILLVEAELLATERLASMLRFRFMTPHHRKLTTFSIHEVFTGLRGQQRIKLVDRVGRVFYYDRDDIVYAGVARERSRSG